MSISQNCYNEEIMNAFYNKLALSLFSLICLLSIVPVSTARSITEPSVGLPPAPGLQNAWTPRSLKWETPALSRFRTGPLGRRTPPGLAYPVIKMKMMTYTTVGLITPVISAARALEDFYSSIAIKAAGVWQAEPRTDHFSIEDGPFRLTFSSMGDSIPWDFVQTFAERLWRCASLGLTNVFDAMFMDDLGQAAVSISLRLIDGSSSSSDTVFQMREGSVPSVTSP